MGVTTLAAIYVCSVQISVEPDAHNMQILFNGNPNGLWRDDEGRLLNRSFPINSLAVNRRTQKQENEQQMNPCVIEFIVI